MHLEHYFIWDKINSWQSLFWYLQQKLNLTSCCQFQKHQIAWQFLGGPEFCECYTHEEHVCEIDKQEISP